MAQYKVGNTGFNVATASMAILVPQPRSTGVQMTKRTFSASGQIYEQSPYIELLFSVQPTAYAYQQLLAKFDLNVFINKGVTVYIPDEQFFWQRYNGIAVRPEMGKDAKRENYFIRDIVILVKHLELLAP